MTAQLPAATTPEDVGIWDTPGVPPGLRAAVGDRRTFCATCGLRRWVAGYCDSQPTCSVCFHELAESETTWLLAEAIKAQGSGQYDRAVQLMVELQDLRDQCSRSDSQRPSAPS